jgi:hypothetical protein
MRIGIARSLTDSASGGVFQYEIVLLKALAEIAANYPEEFVYLCYHPNDLGVLAGAGGLNYRGIPVVSAGMQPAQQGSPDAYLAQKPTTPPPVDPNTVQFNDATEDMLRQNGIDLVLLLSPNIPAFSFRLPFVVPVFDLNHRLQPEFPEVSSYGQTNAREYFYVNTCRYATLLLADSAKGKSDVLRFYGSRTGHCQARWTWPGFAPSTNCLSAISSIRRSSGRTRITL